MLRIAQNFLGMTRMDQRSDFGRRVQRMTDLDALYPLFQPVNELVVDRTLDQRAA